MIDLGDELVDPLRDVLPPLIRVPEVAFQGLDALLLGRQLLPEQSVLLAKAVGGIDQSSDRTLQPLEVVSRIGLDDLDPRIADDFGNGSPRPGGIVTARGEFRQERAGSLGVRPTATGVARTAVRSARIRPARPG